MVQIKERNVTEFEGFGRILIVVGLLIVFLGLILLLAGKVPFLGRLPGDILIQRDNVSCFFPIATMIILSILLSIILSLISLFLRR
ncbi:MAG: DUF2905 domain-containing protein [Chloroflexi bacterium]|nr:DUF2905 domain-containing protein [Chloroflexota bacterium]